MKETLDVSATGCMCKANKQSPKYVLQIWKEKNRLRLPWHEPVLT